MRGNKDFSLQILIVLGICLYCSCDVLNDIIQIVQSNALEALSNCSELTTNSSLIYFNLYTLESPTDPVTYSGSDSDVDLDMSKETKFIIHGWTESPNKTWIQNMKNAYFNTSHDYNVIIVDWSEYASESYATAVCYVPSVGETVADFIVNAGLELGNVHLVAHSLGGQVAGFAGQAINNTQGGKLGRITGLDAAGPLYCFPTLLDANERLSEDDAEFVDAIHTNGLEFGCDPDYGTADFRPDCGRYQTGCTTYTIADIISGLTSLNNSLTEIVFCSHYRSREYFIESIYDNCFSSVQCSSCLRFGLSLCSSNSVAYMGEYCSTNATGDYYLQTNAQEPYCTS